MKAELIKGTYGCPCGQHVQAWIVDDDGAYLDWNGKPFLDYYGQPQTWHQIVIGDGSSYNGVVEVLESKPGEGFDAFSKRAMQRASEIDECGRE
jgi:hypothetical protein